MRGWQSRSFSVVTSAALLFMAGVRLWKFALVAARHWQVAAVGDEALEDLIRQIQGMGRGTRYYVPRT